MIKKTLILLILMTVSISLFSVKELTRDNFNAFIQDGVVLVDFWAEWCAPCKEIAPIIEELSQEMPEVKFGKMNVDENKQIARAMRVQNIPALYIFNNGNFFDAMVGVQPKKELKSRLQAALNFKDKMKKLKAGEIKFTDEFDFNLPDMNGKSHQLSQTDGLIILDFWATWCAPCRRTIPKFEELYNKYKDKGLTIYGITTQEKEKVETFQVEFEKSSMSYPVLLDDKNGITRELRVSSIPTMFIISPEGKLIKKKVGAPQGFEVELEKIIKENL